MSGGGFVSQTSDARTHYYFSRTSKTLIFHCHYRTFFHQFDFWFAVSYTTKYWQLFDYQTTLNDDCNIYIVCVQYIIFCTHSSLYLSLCVFLLCFVFLTCDILYRWWFRHHFHSKLSEAEDEIWRIVADESSTISWQRTSNRLANPQCKFIFPNRRELNFGNLFVHFILFIFIYFFVTYLVKHVRPSKRLTHIIQHNNEFKFVSTIIYIR